MAFAYNPDYVPTGLNNKANAYYKKINNVRIPKSWDGPTFFTPGIIERTTLIIFNTGQVPDPVPAGTYVQMSWTADGQARQVGITTDVERSKASVMQELTQMSLTIAGVATAIYIGDSVHMRSEIDVVLSAPVVTVDVPPVMAEPAPPPDTAWTTHAAAEEWLDQFTERTGIGSPLDWSASATLAQKFQAALQLWQDYTT